MVDGSELGSSAPAQAHELPSRRLEQAEAVEPEPNPHKISEAAGWSGPQHQEFRQLIDGFFSRRARSDREAARLSQAFWESFHAEADRLFLRHRGDADAAWDEVSKHLEPFLLNFQNVDHPN